MIAASAPGPLGGRPPFAHSTESGHPFRGNPAVRWSDPRVGGAALEILEAGLEDAIAVLVLPEKYRRRLRSTNMLERLIQEARRREKVIRIFPDERSAWRLLGALLAEQHELWIAGRRWLAMNAYWEWKQKRETENLERTA